MPRTHLNLRLRPVRSEDGVHTWLSLSGPLPHSMSCDEIGPLIALLARTTNHAIRVVLCAAEPAIWRDEWLHALEAVPEHHLDLRLRRRHSDDEHQLDLFGANR